MGLSGVTEENIEATVTDVANALVEQPPAAMAGAAPAAQVESKPAAQRIHEGTAWPEARQAVEGLCSACAKPVALRIH